MRTKLRLKALCTLMFLASTIKAQQKLNGLSAQLVDETKDAVELASVVLLRLPDSTIVGSAQSGSNGRVLLENVPPGNYAIRISFIGFIDHTIGNIKIELDKVNNLGVITLKQDARLLDEVVIERSVPAVQHTLDRTVFNITADIQAMSSNASELLEQIPMVELNEDGVPSAMGQNLTVLIDGRPSNVYGNNIETVLKLLPSGIIKKVEVITSPSARYTTEQGAIVLNIITEAERLVGISGIASLTSTTHTSIVPSLNLNFIRKRFGFNNSFSFIVENDKSTSSMFRENRLEPVSFINQSNSASERDHDFSYNGNVFYRIGDKSTLSAFFGLGRDQENENQLLLTHTTNAGNDIISAYNRANEGIDHIWQYRGGLDFKRIFLNENQILDFKAFYSERDGNEIEIFHQESAWEELNHQQYQLYTDKDQGFTIQLDYAHPIKEKSTFETGFRANWNSEKNKFTPKRISKATGEYVMDTDLMNDFIGHDRQISAYAMYRTSIDRFSLQAGTRIEKAVLDGEQVLLSQTYKNNFLNLIPTLNLAYRLKNEDNVRFSYNRRARRPRWNQLNPFINYINPENIQSGNPELDPELINSFEFSYGKFINQFNLFGSLFYRHSSNPIQEISTINPEGLFYTTFHNIGKENYYGLETGAGADIIPTWNVRLNIGLRKNEVHGFGNDNSNTSITGRFSTFYSLPFNFRGYAFVNYEGPKAIAQGKMNGMLISDIGIRKSLKDKKVNLSLRITDVFNNRRFLRTLKQTNFNQISNFKPQSRFLILNVSYIFGDLQDSGKDNSEPRAPTNEVGDL